MAVEVHQASSMEAVRQEVRMVVRRLVREEDVAARDIVVLTPRAAEKSGLLGPLGDGIYLVEEPYGSEEVRLTSVYLFKGFESKVVVLAGVPREDQARPELMYVGCSRARSHLVIVELA